MLRGVALPTQDAEGSACAHGRWAELAFGVGIAQSVERKHTVSLNPARSIRITLPLR